MAADMQICLPYMEELVGLVKCFSQRFDAKKRQENVIDFSDMFNGCSSLENIELSSFDTTNATNMANMFYILRV